MALEHRMIEPFESSQVRAGRHLLWSQLLRVRHAGRQRDSAFSPTSSTPSSIRSRSIRNRSSSSRGDVCIVPPNSFALARSVEYFRIPRNVLTVTLGKSTYARCGIITNVTPARARVGGTRHARDLEHDSPARQDLRERRHRPGAVLQGRGGAAGVVQGQEREVPGPDRCDPAQVKL